MRLAVINLVEGAQDQDAVAEIPFSSTGVCLHTCSEQHCITTMMLGRTSRLDASRCIANGLWTPD